MTRPAAVSVDDSFEQCVALTRRHAKNFHYAFMVLPRERYRGICSLYAFTRIADDISDDEKDPVKALENSAAWRKSFERALAGDGSDHPVLPAVAETMKRFEIPPQYMHDLITGTEMDGRQSRYEKWDDTYLYCYRVASVIGMMTVHVFGFSDKQAVVLAEKMGIAFQMTNILRDIGEDASRKRIYLPQEDLRKFGVSPEDLLAAKDSPAARKLIQFEAERTMQYYNEGRPLIPMILPESRPAMQSLVSLYQRLLEKIIQRKYDVFSSRVSLSKMEKLWFAASFMMRRAFSR